MIEPVQNRNPADLAPLFRSAYADWLLACAERPELAHVTFITTETRRTYERQRWLYAQGRQEPFLDRPKVSWTLDSYHLWGLAADFVIQRKDTRDLIWTPASYQWLYRLVPPEPFGLRHIAPLEYVHLEYRYAAYAITDPAMQLVRT